MDAGKVAVFVEGGCVAYPNLTADIGVEVTSPPVIPVDVAAPS